MGSSNNNANNNQDDDDNDNENLDAQLLQQLYRQFQEERLLVGTIFKFLH